MTVVRSRVSVPATGWLAVATAVVLLIAAWVIMLRDGWTAASAATVIAPSLIVAGVYLAQQDSPRPARHGRSLEHLTHCGSPTAPPS